MFTFHNKSYFCRFIYTGHDASSFKNLQGKSILRQFLICFCYSYDVILSYKWAYRWGKKALLCLSVCLLFLELLSVSYHWPAFRHPCGSSVTRIVVCEGSSVESGAELTPKFSANCSAADSKLTPAPMIWNVEIWTTKRILMSMSIVQVDQSAFLVIYLKKMKFTMNNNRLSS